LTAGVGRGSSTLARIAAWLLSQDCATKTASKPNTTAKPTITRVLARMRRSPFAAAQFFSFVAANIAGASIELVKAAALSFLSSTGFKPAFFTERFLKCLQLNQFLIAPDHIEPRIAASAPVATVFKTDRFKI